MLDDYCLELMSLVIEVTVADGILRVGEMFRRNQVIVELGYSDKPVQMQRGVLLCR